DAMDLDLGATQRVIDKLSGHGPPDGELDQAAGRAAHLADGAGQVRADVVPVDLYDQISGLQARDLGRGAVDGAQNLHRRVFGHDFDPHAGIGAHGAQADLFEFVAVQVGRVGVERGHHAPNGLLHQRMVVDVVDVLVLDAFVDFG